jgi:hypothetical protein
MCSRHAYCRHPGTVEPMRSRRRFEVRGARNGTLAVGPVGSFAGSHIADWQPLFHINRRLTPMLRHATLAAPLLIADHRSRSERTTGRHSCGRAPVGNHLGTRLRDRPGVGDARQVITAR